MNAPFMQAGFIRAEIDKLLAQFPELADDETLRLDMIEAETDLLPLLSKLISQRADKASMADAIKIRIADLSERKARFERGADAVKALIHSLMDAAGQDKITLPEATVFTTKPRTSVEITDITALPQGYFETVRKAKTADIKSALEKGEDIPGAALQIGESGITIRTK